jgi:predicted HTH transcriptional regulator
MDPGTRWTDRIVSNAATWSGNIFDFYTLVIPRLELGLKTPFSLSGMTRVDDTALHHVLRESLANTLIHANYYERRGAVITRYPKGFTFSNPGILRVPKEDAIQGGLSDPRNATLFTMFTLLNIGERAGSGLSNIFSVWKAQGWKEPVLEEFFQPERTTLQLIMEEPVRMPDIVEERGRYPGDTGDKAQQQRQKILTFLESVDSITNKQVCILLGVNRSRAYDLLSQMVCESLLIAEGDKKGRRYRLR